MNIPTRSYPQEHRVIDATQNLMFNLLLENKICLHEIPWPVRADKEVYTGAFRVSRYYISWHLEDIRLLMKDIETICEERYFYGRCISNHQLKSDMISQMIFEVGISEFKREDAFVEFEENCYKPFLQKMQIDESKYA